MMSELDFRLHPYTSHPNGPCWHSRPAEAQAAEGSKKRTRDEPAEAEPVDDNQFGKSPKKPKVKKALIVSGGLCGFKVRNITVTQVLCTVLRRVRLLMHSRDKCECCVCKQLSVEAIRQGLQHPLSKIGAQVAGDLPLRSYSYSEEPEDK